MQVHGYPYSDGGSTFIVEMHEDVWRRAGFDATEDTEFPPGASDEQAIARLRELFADELDGHELYANNSKWLNFTTVRNERWHHGNLVLRRRRRAHRALLDRFRHQAGDGGLARARRLPARAPGRRDRARAYEAERRPGGRVHPARRPGVTRVVREHRHVRGPTTRSSSPSTC